jgi:hypothetical protein
VNAVTHLTSMREPACFVRALIARSEPSAKSRAVRRSLPSVVITDLYQPRVWLPLRIPSGQNGVMVSSQAYPPTLLQLHGQSPDGLDQPPDAMPYFLPSPEQIPQLLYPKVRLLSLCCLCVPTCRFSTHPVPIQRHHVPVADVWSPAGHSAQLAIGASNRKGLVENAGSRSPIAI